LPNKIASVYDELGFNVPLEKLKKIKKIEYVYISTLSSNSTSEKQTIHFV